MPKERQEDESDTLPIIAVPGRNALQSSNDATVPRLSGVSASMSSSLSGVNPALASLPSLQTRQGVDPIITDNNVQRPEQCATCLYTGVATCTGLSGYFVKVALMDLPTKGSMEVLLKAQKDKRFLLVFASCWAVAGAYRFHLG